MDERLQRVTLAILVSSLHSICAVMQKSLISATKYATIRLLWLSHYREAKKYQSYIGNPFATSTQIGTLGAKFRYIGAVLLLP